MNIDIAFITGLILKSFVLLGLGLYGIFAVVMVRQEHLMADVLEEGFEPVLRLLMYIHLFAAIGTFLLAVMLL